MNRLLTMQTAESRSCGRQARA